MPQRLADIGLTQTCSRPWRTPLSRPECHTGAPWSACLAPSLLLCGNQRGEVPPHDANRSFFNARAVRVARPRQYGFRHIAMLLKCLLRVSKCRRCQFGNLLRCDTPTNEKMALWVASTTPSIPTVPAASRIASRAVSIAAGAWPVARLAAKVAPAGSMTSRTSIRGANKGVAGAAAPRARQENRGRCGSAAAWAGRPYPPASGFPLLPRTRGDHPP